MMYIATNPESKNQDQKIEINAIINHRPASYLQHKVQRFCNKLIENVWLNFKVFF